MQLFISYARPDRSRAESLTLRLRQAGITVWLDSDLVGGQAWWDRILDQLRSCDAAVVVISRASIKSQACQSEREYAIRLGKPILPLMLEPIGADILPAEIAKIKSIDYSAPSEATAFQLVGAILSLPAPGELPDPLPAEPPVPTSPFGSLVDRIAEPNLSMNDQLAIIGRLESALGPAADPHDAQHALELLRQMDERSDLFAATARQIEKIRAQLNAGQAPPAAPGRRMRSPGRDPREAGAGNRTAPSYQAESVRTAVISIRRQVGELQSKLNAWIVLIDGEKVGKISQGQRREFHVPPGTHHVQIKISAYTSYASPVEVLTLNDGDHAGFSCSLDNPLSVRDTFSVGAWKNQLMAQRDTFIRLDRE